MVLNISEVYSFSNLGQRTKQEDAYSPVDPSPEDWIFTVCDGVGGLSRGEVASQTVCEAFTRQNQTSSNDVYDAAQFEQDLCEVYRQLAEAQLDGEEMATTLVYLHINTGGIFTAHIGDSRIYQIRPGKGILYRSCDHSWVAEFVKAGIMSEEEARKHPGRNEITRAMASSPTERRFEQATVRYLSDIRQGDVLILCTDGVTNEITDTELTELFAEEIPFMNQCHKLEQLCIDSQDNNTATIIQIGEVDNSGLCYDAPEEEFDTDIDFSQMNPNRKKVRSALTEYFKHLFGHKKR